MSLTLEVTGAGAPAEGTQQAQLVGRPVDRRVSFHLRLGNRLGLGIRHPR